MATIQDEHGNFIKLPKQKSHKLYAAKSAALAKKKVAGRMGHGVHFSHEKDGIKFYNKADKSRGNTRV
jgi:hypothetical protein